MSSVDEGNGNELVKEKIISVPRIQLDSMKSS
jgi:hypothetical protein